MCLLAHMQYGTPIPSRAIMGPACKPSSHFGFSLSGIWSMACDMLSYRLSVSACTLAGWILESVRSILMGCRWERRGRQPYRNREEVAVVSLKGSSGGSEVDPL